MSIAIPPTEQPDPGSLDPSSLLVVLDRALAGRYTLEREVGRGGMASVFLAYDPGLDRRVALKVLPPESSRESRRAFLQEARLAARVKHSGIVPVHQVEEAGEFVFYTMDFVEGGTLAERVQLFGRFSVAEATRILYAIATAVAKGHDRGLVHRDLKPQNILMDGDDPKVTDFGIARLLREPEPPPKQVVGTLPYLSPEQLWNLAADCRSDVYSLGAIGYYLINGEPPIIAPNVDAYIRRHAFEPPARVSATGEHLDTTYAEVVNRCLEKDPDKRFQSADEVAAALVAAPELRKDLPQDLREFLWETKQIPARSATAVVLALLLLPILLLRLPVSESQRAAIQIGALLLAFAAPAAVVVAAAWRLLRGDYTQNHLYHALSIDLDRQVADRPRRKGQAEKPLPSPVVPMLLTLAGLTGIGVFLWAGYQEWNWSEGEFMGGLLASMLTALIAGSIWTWRMRKINALTGNRWRLILTSSVGRALVRLARLGLAPRPAEPQRSPVDDLMRGALLRELQLGGVRVSALRDMVHAEYRLSSGQEGSAAALELEELRTHAKDQLKPLEDTLERLLGVDAASADLQSLTADLEAIQQVGIAVDHIIARHRALMGNGMHLIK